MVPCEMMIFDPVFFVFIHLIAKFLFIVNYHMNASIKLAVSLSIVVIVTHEELTKNKYISLFINIS
jgi:hypothetical protein